MAAVRILFVCAGNICRSPTAEGVLRAKLKAAGLDDQVDVESAGTHGFHASEPPDPRAIRQAAARGYDLSAQRARRVSRADFDRFDRMLAMDDENMRWLRERAPQGSTAQLSLLLEHAPRHAAVREVPDPYFGAPAGFDRVLDLVEDGCDGLVAELRCELGTS